MKNTKHIILYVVSALIIITLWYFQFQISVNIPWWDDFHGIILPVSNLFSNSTFIEKLKLFFSLNNEHRVVNDRIFTLLIYLIFGKFELKFLALLGFVNLILIYLIILKACRRQVVNPLYFIPVVFILFQAQYYESLQSLMVPFQNFSVILYTLLSFYFLIFRKSNHIFISIVLATLGLFSHGNGILAFVIGFFILVFNKNYKSGIIWLTYSALIIVLYFWGYQKPEWSNEIKPFSNPILSIFYTFQFLGAYINIILDSSTRLSQSNLKPIISGVFGFVLVVTLISVFVVKYKPLKNENWIEKLRNCKTDQFLLSIMGFVMATGILIGLTRVGFPMLSRYTINSALLSLSVYLFLIINIYYKKMLFAAVGAISLVLLIISYYNYSETAIYKKQNAVADGYNYQTNHTWASQYSDSSHVARLNPLLKEPLKSKKYLFPKSYLDHISDFNISDSIVYVNNSIVDSYLELSGMVDENKTINPFENEDGIYFSLSNHKYSFIFPAIIQKNSPKDFILERTYFSKRFKSAFPLKVIPQGQYNVQMILIKGEKRIIYPTNKTIKTPYMIL